MNRHASSERERMAPVDTAWLRMDRENHLMAIKVVLMLDGAMSLSTLRLVLERKLIRRFPRFTHRAVQDDDQAWWEPDLHFRLNNHVRRRQLGAGAPDAQLQALVARLAHEPLDPDRPLWMIDLVERCGNGAAIILRVHHCLADGLSLIDVLLSLTGGGERRGTARIPWSSESSSASDPNLVRDAQTWHSFLHSLAAGDSTPGSLALEMWLRSADFSDDSMQARSAGTWWSQTGTGLMSLLLPDDSATILKGRSGAKKELAWAPSLALDEVTAVARYLRCSVNDIALACVAEALRRYLMGRGESVEGVQIRVLVPVALRRIGDRRRLGRLGNQFGFVPLLLPLDLDCPLQRVREVRSRMLSLRRSVLPPVAMGLMGLVGLAPRAVQEKARGLFARKATGVVTHVPGPQEPVRLAHRRIDRVLFWVPQSGEVGLGVSIITYAGTLQMSLISDAGLVRDPEQVCLHFVQSFNDLLLGLLMGLDNPPNPGV